MNQLKICPVAIVEVYLPPCLLVLVYGLLVNAVIYTNKFFFFFWSLLWNMFKGENTN